LTPKGLKAMTDLRPGQVPTGGQAADESLDETALFLLHGKTSQPEVPASQLITSKQPVLNSKAWILAFTRFHRIPVFKRVWVYLAVMAVYTIGIDWLTDRNLAHTVVKEAGAAAYGSVVMGSLLVFRTNTAYERWNEGRKLWGQLVNDSRNLSLKVRSFVNVPEIEKIELGQLIVSFAFALKHHLRNSTPSEPLPGLGRDSKNVRNLPVHVASKIFDKLAQWKQANYIDTLMLIQMDFHIRAFMDVCGACERIKNSPIAVSYRAFMRQGIVMNLIVSPWLLSTEFPLIWGLPIILIGTYFLIGLELIAEDIEEPFGKDGDDLPLDTICATIRTTVTDILNLQRAMKYTRTIDSSAFDPLRFS